MPSGPCDFEILVLRHLNGEDIPNLSWGAAMGAAIEFLSGDGLITRGPTYKITDKGKDFLRKLAIAREDWPVEEPCIHQRASFGEDMTYCPDCGERWVSGSFPDGR